ncbi:MAG: Gfo/Idh/MocA family oxidoreductase [Pseudomonadota bacterium]
MRVLVTGRGSIAKRHVRHLRALRPDVELAVVSASGEVDPVFQPCTVVKNVGDGFFWKPDALVIASISSRHAGELVLAFEHSLPCLVEKPLVTDQAQLNQIFRFVGQREIPLAIAVGCNLRHLPALAKLRQELSRDPSLRVLRAHLEVGQELTQWRPGRDLKTSYSAFPSQGGGVVFDLVHEIDMARWLLGPLKVQAGIGGHFSSLPVESDDVHVALLKTGPGAPVVVSLDYVSQSPVRRYSFVTTEGTYVADLMEKNIVHRGREVARILSNTAADFDIAATYTSQMADWLAAIANPGHKLISPLVDGLETAALMLDIYEARA